MQWVLEDEGLTVETAADGRQALQRAAEHPPSLVVLDMGLPLIDGFGVAAGLRAHGQDVPILVVSADDRVAEKARQVGAFEALPKPFGVDDLLSAVRQGLELQ